MFDSVELLDARRDLYRALQGALGHERPGGPHHHLNAEQFIRELERFIDTKIEKALSNQRRAK
jgi:hypothetical protein